MLTKEERSNRTCRAEGCDRPVYAKGVCTKHYYQLRNHGRLTPELERAEYTTEELECTEEHCHNTRIARGLCGTHYQQWKRSKIVDKQVEDQLAEEEYTPPPAPPRRVVRRRA